MIERADWNDKAVDKRLLADCKAAVREAALYRAMPFHKNVTREGVAI